MTFAQNSQHATPEAELDAKVRTVKSKAEEFANLPVGERARLVAAMVPATREVAAEWVAAACRYKDLDPSSPLAAEDWLTGPVITIRAFRLLADTLSSIARTGRAPARPMRTRPDGRVEVSVFPTSAIDGAMFVGFKGWCLMQAGLDEKGVLDKQAAWYHDKSHKPSVSVVLGAGNVSSIPPTDTIYKMMAEGRVVVLKMNPVNEYVGPFLERAMKPLIDRGYLQIAYGAGDAGKHLVEHPDIDDIHITGSDKTHDLIIWGPPGPEQERRKRENDPVLKKTITSELGNVSPVMIVPGPYRDDELWFMARNVASQVQNNASFNCNAAKMLVLSSAWPQADLFRDLLRRALGQLPVRKAYYPGAFDRYAALTEPGGGKKVEKFGDEKPGTLRWAYVQGLDAGNPNERLFSTEPFCGILSEVALPEGEPAAFLAAATRFCNDTLWGTLNASLIIHPQSEKDAKVAAALDRALVELRYGTVGINHWAGMGYGLVSMPWGGHPSSTLANVQSGIGWVHNTYLLEGIDKAIVRGPLVVKTPHPAWFYDNKAALEIMKKMVDLEAAPSWLKVAPLAMTALRG